jgi:hypothetical protein
VVSAALLTRISMPEEEKALCVSSTIAAAAEGSEASALMARACVP